MKRTLLAALALSGVLLSAAGPASAQSKEIRFGCYAPMTGQLAIFGRSMQNGIDMAVEDFAKRPESKGIQYVIRCEDDQGRADDGINLARKFIEDPSIKAVIGSWSSTVTLAAGPLYDKAKLVNITPISSHPDVTKIGPYVYRQSNIQSREGKVNADYLQKLGVKSIAMIGIPNDYGKANIHFTRAEFEKVGGKVVFEEFVRPDAQDFRQTLQKALRNKPDSIYLGVFAPQAALMLKQLRQMGNKTPVFLAAANDSPDLIRLAGNDAVEGVHMAVLFNPVIGPKLADFFKRYEAKFGAPPDPFAGNAYTTAMMLQEITAKQYPDVTRESVRKGLDEIRTLDSIFGKMEYDPATREWAFKFFPGVIENGKVRITE